ncbi:MAG: hypothetical protein GWN62_22615 [Aliifodinibius sp.]|nr:hypothetical protein [Fodinibius sp.]
MNKNTRAGIKKAAGLTAAGQKQLHNKAYHKSVQLSSLKTLIGEFLLFGNKQRKEFWILFESRLRTYVDLKISGGTR